MGHTDTDGLTLEPFWQAWQHMLCCTVQCCAVVQVLVTPGT
jgi:hypothetical protein